jgi:hypothetical protein
MLEPSTKSSAKRTTTTSPRASRLLHVCSQRSNTYGRYTFARSRETVAPCGVPSSVLSHLPSSRTPAAERDRTR